MTATIWGRPNPSRVDLRRVASVALAAAVVAVLTGATALVPFALPADDDYFRAVRYGFGHPGLSWWRYVFQFCYVRWQGRWAACGLEAALLGAVDLTRRYPLVVAVVCGADAMAVVVVCRWFTRAAPWRFTLSVAAVAVALLWAGMPSVAEGVYWVTGGVENVFCLAVGGAFLVAVAAAAGRADVGPTSALTGAGLAVAAVAVCGFHELWGNAVWLATTAGAVLTRRPGAARWGAVGPWAWAWAGATTGLAVVVLAPGNQHRITNEVLPHSRQLGYALRLAGRLLGADLLHWARDPKLLAASAWVAVSPTLEAARRPWPSAARVGWRWVVPVTGAVAVGVGYALPCYAFGARLPPRTVSGNWAVFVATWLLTVYAWSRPLAKASGDAPTPWDGLRRGPAPAAALVVLAAALVLTGNLPVAVADLAGPARPWHAAEEGRYALLRRAGPTDVVLTRLPRHPRLLVGGEVFDGGDNWRNVGLASYLGVRRVTLEPARANGGG